MGLADLMAWQDQMAMLGLEPDAEVNNAGFADPPRQRRRAPAPYTPRAPRATWDPSQLAAHGAQITAGMAGQYTNAINSAVSKEMESRRKIAAEMRKRQADAEADERQRQHELKLEQMRIDALAQRLDAYQPRVYRV